MLAAGIHVVDHGDGTIGASTSASPQPVRMQVKTWARPIGPSVVHRLASDKRLLEGHFPVGETPAAPAMLLIAPSLSPETRTAIEELDWSWVVDSSAGSVTGRLRLANSASVSIGPRPDDSDKPLAAARGRKPRQRHAIIRHLLLGRSWTQSDLIELCRVSQPRVSQVLNSLLTEGLVARSPAHGLSEPSRWIVADSVRLIDSWLTSYPGPGGAAPTYWLGLDDITEQARTAWKFLDRWQQVDTKPVPVVSGDAAADYIAPYRRAQLAVLYSPTGADLTPAGFTPAPRQHATLKLVVPSDSSVWPHPRDDRSRELAANAPYPLADPLQVAWDLLDSGSPDADQGADALKAALLDLRSRDQWR